MKTTADFQQDADALRDDDDAETIDAELHPAIAEAVERYAAEMGIDRDTAFQKLLRKGLEVVGAGQPGGAAGECSN